MSAAATAAGYSTRLAACVAAARASRKSTTRNSNCRKRSPRARRSASPCCRSESSRAKPPRRRRRRPEGRIPHAQALDGGMSARSGGLFVGRLDAKSGIATLAEALDLFPGAHVEVVGTGPGKASSPAIRACGCSGRSGRRKCRTGCAGPPTSFFPASPMSSCRGRSSGVRARLAAIASRVEQLAEMVEPGRNGLLFEPGSARELARRLAWAEAFPERMRQMGVCAKADYLARFTHTGVSKALRRAAQSGARVADLHSRQPTPCNP